MKQGPMQLLLDSVIIGIVAATLLLVSVLVFDVSGTGRALAAVGTWPLAFIWLHLSIMATPFGTLAILARDAE